MREGEVRQVIRRLRPVIGDEADRLWSTYMLLASDQRADLEQWLSILAHQLLGEAVSRDDVLLPTPRDPHVACYGEYDLGFVMYNGRALCRFGIRESEWLTHVLIVGRSGSGKTNTVLQVLEQFLSHGKPFWIFDFKRNYRDLLERHEGGIHVFTVGRDVAPFAFNPLTPGPGESRGSRARHVTEWIRKTFQIRDGAESLILRALHALPDQDGTLRDAERVLRDMPVTGRQAQWHITATRALHSINSGALGTVFNSCGPAMPVLLESSVIFELDGLTSKERNLFRDAILHSRHVHKLAAPNREAFQDALIVEEAHHLLRKTTAQTAEDVLSTALREERELGTAIIVVDQLPSKLSEVAFANTATTVALNQKSKPDMQVLASSLVLSDEDAAGLTRLPVGHALVKLQHRPTLPCPILVKIHQVKIRKGSITDAHLNARQASTHFAHFSTQNPSGDGFHAFRAGNKVEQETSMHDEETAFLNDVKRHPDSPVTARYTRLGLNPRKGSRVQSALMNRGYLTSTRVITRTGATSALQLTAKAQAILRLCRPPGRRGGATHQLIINQLARELQNAGYSTRIEHSIGDGRSIDILASKDGMDIAIEVEAGRARHLKQNITGCLQAGYTQVIIVAANETVERRVRSVLAAQNRSISVTVALPKNVSSEVARLVTLAPCARRAA